MSGGAVAAATAAAAAAEKKRREEEEMTNYSAEDLNGWEFKIVRSALERFSNYEAVQRVCREEAAAGWELVEKFDNGRLRFKRRVEERAQDAHRTVDPYRSAMGIASGARAGLIVGLTLIVLGLGAALFFLMQSGG